ncbi:MAG: TIR domain-containing protein, partial [Sphingomonas sp.]|nr:TIR domain-containing protein [Sphingomonas sp.]
MNEAGSIADADRRSAGPVFISYATADRKEALSICRALESRGTACWISTRDVKPGENYQEAIVHALRQARAVVVIFSGAANNSDEIKKELSLASRHRVPVIAFRIEDVEPSDAFAYELSTRQWIDAFAGRSKSLDLLAERLSSFAATSQVSETAFRHPPRVSHRLRRWTMLAAPVAFMLLLAVGAWQLLSPSTHHRQSMVVRLASFEALSNDLPPAMAKLIREEVIAAFGDDGVIRFSTASTPPSGDGPAYVLAGSVRRDGDRIRVITRLTNERSQAALWTDTFDYEAKDVDRVARRIAVDAGNMVHCGLFAASTYGKPLPDEVMSDYMQFCSNSWWAQSFSDPEKALVAAQKVAAALPDFSWGWSAITVASELVFYRTPPGAHREEVRRLGLQAADKALAINPRNSEAYAQKSMLIGRDWEQKESLFKRAIAAQPLFCGCEHFLYGVMLRNVGRLGHAADQMERSTEMLSLDGISQFGLAEDLLMMGKADEAKPHFDAAIDLFRDPGTAPYIAVRYSTETRDYASGLKSLADRRVHMSDQKRSAVRAAFQALAAADAVAKKRAAEGLLGLPASDKDSLVTRLLGALGAKSDALRIIETRAIDEDFSASSWLWFPSMRPALDDPSFPGMAQRLGLIRYWRSSRTRPDVCSSGRAPA